MKQKIALEILKKGHNVFLTGPAGSGKTYLLNTYIKYLKKNNIRYAVTASTGIAATHLFGRTIHSWSGIGINDHLSEKEIADILKNHLIKERLTKTDILIIDEISMIHAHQLDLVNKILRLARASWEPFGGMQVIFSGDFFQLPPISKKTDEKKKFVYDAQSWKESDLHICYLSEQFRHKENTIATVLNSIRKNAVDENVIELLQESGDNYDPRDSLTRLFTHNVDVDIINNRELQKIPGKAFSYNMMGDGSPHIIAALKNNCLALESLILKEGALVMFVRNNFGAGCVDGTIGTVIDFDEENYPIVEMMDGQEVTVYPEKWALEENNEILAEIMQLPLRLAWAITVHKSQGMTLDAAEIDLRKCFEYGMGYVALSRVRSLSHMRLLGINDMALKVDPQILKKDKEFQQLSQKSEKIF